jgi:hypothetical protein
MVTNPASPVWLLEFIELCDGSKSICFSGVYQPNAFSGGPSGNLAPRSW